MTSTLSATEWKLQASGGNHSQVAMPFLSAVALPEPMPAHVVSRATFSGCLNDAVRHSGKEDQEIADDIHISSGYMSRFMRGVAEQWAKRLVRFMRSTNSIAPLQWLAEQMGCDVVQRDSRAAEVAALKQRLTELEKAA